MSQEATLTMKQFKNAIMLYRLAITRAALYSIVTLGSAWQVATNGKDLANQSLWDWFALAVGIIVLWGNQMVSFLDKTMSRMQTGQNPFESGQTEFIKKQPENG